MTEYPACSHNVGLFKCKSLSMRDIQVFHNLFYKKHGQEYLNKVILRYVEVKNIQRRHIGKNKTNNKQQLQPAN